MLRTKPILIITAMFAISWSAQATVEKTFSWAFSQTSGTGTRCIDPDGSATTNNGCNSTTVGNTYNFQTSTGNAYENNVSVKAFSTTNDASDPNPNGFETATIRMWNGLGVVSREDTDTAPHHSMDNDGGTSTTTSTPDETVDSGDVDAAFFSFDQAISLDSIKIGWTNNSDDEIVSATNNDADISVLAYTGTGAPATIATNATSSSTVNNKSFATLLSEGWEFVGHYANLLNNSVTNSIDTKGKTSSYWLISAYTSHADGDGSSNAPGSPIGLDFGNDYFKIAGLGGKTITTTPPPPPSEIPEPTSLVLLALALMGWGMTRNKLGLANSKLAA